MRDFDQERRARNAEREAKIENRTFTFGGETFEIIPTVSYVVLGQIADTDEQGASQTISVLEDSICEMLVSGCEKFLEIARSKTDPVTFTDLNAICTAILEMQSGRPTLAPSPSTAGDETTSTPSTDASSTKPAVVSAA